MDINTIKDFLEKHPDLDADIKEFKVEKNLGGVSFERIYNTRKHKFGLALRGSDENIFIGFNADIYMLEIESIITPNLVKNGIIGDSVLHTFQPTIGIAAHHKLKGLELLSEYEKNISIELVSSKDLDALLPMINSYWNNNVKSFFDNWTSILDFVPIIENADNKKLIEIFDLHGRYKKLIIWRLCNHPEYDSYMDEIILLIENALKINPNEKFYHQHLNAHKELKEVLAKSFPLYEWDEKYRTSSK
jgi:hypothetical protein